MKLSFLDKLLFLFVGLLNKFFDLYAKGNKRPVIFDIDASYPSLNSLTENYQLILDEYQKVAEKYTIAAYHDLSPDQHEISGKYQPEKKWKVFIINGTGRFTPEGLEDCPETCNLLQNIPGLFHATFSTLEPGKYVPPHEGPYRGYIRYHLCLRAPENNPPYIRVHDQYHTWKAGNAVLFDDTWEHEVYNEASEERTVMMVDVMRPMPWFPTLVNKFIRDFIIRPFYGLKTMRMQTRTLNQLAKTEDKVHA